MSGPEPRPAFSLNFDPRAWNDLLAAPSDIRDLALAQLQDVVNARLFGGKLTGDLAGLRKLYVDHRAAWRIVYAQRPAPAGSAFRTEIHVVAVRPRDRHDVYNTAAARLGIKRRPVSALTHAARARSPQLDGYRPVPKPGAVPYPMPGLPQPALTSLTTKGPTR
ncbi:type II toxin-antitoxin system RelE/ParE family toxin [Streptomyces sp. NPDC086023]|uniref:type II toxin-antitoxin system RelE/ParE family toxin n=1 Tax=Streptomyces sp. NPDC086023 TaxID=3365746 RepID=UPI0037D33BDB